MTIDTAQTTPARVVLITGGNRGIGLAIANTFARNGDRVAITSRKDGPIEGLDASVGVYVGDVTVQSDVDQIFSAIEADLGPVQVLVANAGVTNDGLFVKMSDQAWLDTIDTNLTGVFRVARRASMPMMKARAGSIILMSSVVAMTGSAGQVNYATTKAGMIGFARSLARELGSRGVRVNVIAPGPIATDMLDALEASQRDAMTAMVPLGRVGTTDDVAQAALFLGSDAASYITGAVLPVDGGMGMGH